MAELRRECGEAFTCAFLVKIVTEVVNYFNIGKSMSPGQIAQTVIFIMDDYYYLKPDDFKLCFSKAMKGNYGRLYDRLDGQIILDWIAQYTAERLEAGAQLTQNEANERRRATM